MSQLHVGRVFRAWRKQSGHTFDTASDALDCGRSTLEAIERGHCYPSFKTLCRFVERSGVEFAELLEASKQ